jgi:hypothetical protein
MSREPVATPLITHEGFLALIPQIQEPVVVELSSVTTGDGILALVLWKQGGTGA